MTIHEKLLRATHEGELVIGDLKIPSAVLEDGTRVLISKGFLIALGRPWKGSSRTNMPNFLGAKNLIPFVSKELFDGLTPIKYENLRGTIVSGFKAEILPLVCDVYLRAREEKKLGQKQEPVAQKAEILVRSLSKVGIVALVDECTGYQYDRDKDALAKILSAYIRQEFLPWAKRFPDEFYQQLFRLKNWQYNPPSVKRPILVGKITEDIVYRRLPLGVLQELKKLNPKDDKGRRKHRHHQLLTEEIGHPHLERHIASVITLMRISPTWGKFKRHVERAFPILTGQLALVLRDKEQEDSE
jgi:hypothetical protein